MSDNNDLTRRLIKESELLTSDDFTSQVMNRVNRMNQPILIPSWQLHVFVFSIIFIIGMTIFYFKNVTKVFSSINLTFYLPPMSLEVLMVVFVLFAINKLIRLKQESQKNEALHR